MSSDEDVFVVTLNMEIRYTEGDTFLVGVLLNLAKTYGPVIARVNRPSGFEALPSISNDGSRTNLFSTFQHKKAAIGAYG